MKQVLLGCEPAEVFAFFEELSAIPRGSKNEKAASDYVMEFAKQRGLAASRDALYNTVVKKPGSPGCESAPAVILQAHLDMVCDKRPDVEFDFEKEGIRLIKDGDWVRADGTTLGADNGIGVAMVLAVLASSDLPHPPIEAAFTVQEEIGLVGARAMDFTQFEGRMILNLDSDNPDVVTVGCCGGMDFVLRQAVTREQPGDYTAGVKISLSGLHGGHSGTDITLNRGSAIKLLGRALNLLSQQVDYRICSVEGGGKRNAIPRDAQAVIVFPAAAQAAGQQALEQVLAQIKAENRDFEPELFWASEAAPVGSVFCAADMHKLIALLTLYPDGVNTRSYHFDDMAESSTNAGILLTDQDGVELSGMIRSNSATRHLEIADKFSKLAAAMGLTVEFSGQYPAWEYNTSSALLGRVKECYRNRTGKEIQIMATHGGLECGLFSDALPGSQVVSIGAQIQDLHSPVERMQISSVGQAYGLVCDLLEKLANAE